MRFTGELISLRFERIVHNYDAPPELDENGLEGKVAFPCADGGDAGKVNLASNGGFSTTGMQSGRAEKHSPSLEGLRLGG